MNSSTTEKTHHEHCSTACYSLNFKSLPTSPQHTLDLVAPYLDASKARLLDLGCGDGVVSQMLADKVAHLTCTDISPEMIEAAASRGLTDVRVLDGHNLLDHIQERDETGSYDVIFSNLTLHWMSRDPEKVLRGVHKALKPGGVFVAQYVGHLSNTDIFLALCHVMEKRGYSRRQWAGFFTPDTDEYKALLEKHGFMVDVIADRFEPLPLVSGIDAHFNTFVRRQLEMLSESEKEEVLEELRQDLEIVCHRNGKWKSVVNYINFRAFNKLD